MRDLIREYLTAAGEQIRWDRARPTLLAELEDHLLCEREAALARGLSEEEARAEAVRQMGDPVTVGQELDRVHRPKPQWGLLGLTLAIAMAVTVLRVELTRDWWFSDCFFQGNDSGNCYLALFLGTALMLAGHFLDDTILAGWGNLLFPAGLLLGFLFLPNYAVPSSPLAKPAIYYVTHIFHLVMPLCYGGWLYARRKGGRKGLLLSLLPLPALPFIMYTSHYGYTLGAGSFLLLPAVCMVMLLVLTWKDWYGLGRVRSRLLAAGLALLCCAGFLYFTTLPSPAHSLSAFLHPELYVHESDTYTAILIREIVSKAHWLGPSDWTAPANQLDPGSYWISLPGAGNNFFPVTVLHRLGWLPYLLLSGGFLLLTLLLLVRGLRQKNVLGRVVSLSIALPLLLQTMCGIVTSLGFIWFPVPFPLVGGNCDLAVQMGLIGLALSVFRQETLPVTDKKDKPLFLFRPDQTLTT